MSRRENGAFTPRTRLLILERDGGRCQMCGTDYGLNIQHRRARGMGGSRSKVTACTANGVLLCGSGTTGCHGWVEGHPDEARAIGLAVPAWADPREIPVHTHDGVWLLDEFGGRQHVEEVVGGLVQG